MLDRCRMAADMLAFALEHRNSFSPDEYRGVAQMTRCLLRAQQVDWWRSPDPTISAKVGLQHARATLISFTHWPACSWPAGPIETCSSGSNAVRGTCLKSTSICSSLHEW